MSLCRIQIISGTHLPFAVRSAAITVVPAIRFRTASAIRNTAPDPVFQRHPPGDTLNFNPKYILELDSRKVKPLNWNQEHSSGVLHLYHIRRCQITRTGFGLKFPGSITVQGNPQELYCFSNNMLLGK